MSERGIVQQGGGGILRFCCEDHEVNFSLQSLGGAHPCCVLAPRSIKAQAARCDSGELRSARGNVNVVTRAIEEGCDDAADSSSTNDSDSHPRSLRASLVGVASQPSHCGLREAINHRLAPSATG